MSDISPFEQRTAFSPGHITGFFQICPHDDPHRKGSVGGGIVLNKGIRAAVTPYRGVGDTELYLNGRQKATDFSDESANSILTVVSELSKIAADKYNSPFHFKIEESGSLPVGSGFGLSAAGALSAAFAVNSSLNLGLSKEVLIEIAHCAEAINGSGLGDVAGIAGGGLAVREKPGASAYGRFCTVPLSEPDLKKTVHCLVLGELSTKAVITDDDCIQRINRAGSAALQNFLKKPDLDSFMTESLMFTKSIGLLSAEAEKVIDSIDTADGKAAQAMLGNTVFAVSSGREGADEYISERMQKFGDVYECRIEAGGPRVCLPAY